WSRISKDAAMELKLLQEVLADAQYRAVPVIGEEGGAPAPAAIAAARQIDDLIKRDPTVYQPVQQAAQQAMEEARASNDPAKLLAVAQVYPNATVAPQALLAAESALQAADN